MASKPKGNRKPVTYVNHPDTEQPVDGLRLHKTTGRYYRIEGNKRTYYQRRGLTGVNYLRRAI